LFSLTFRLIKRPFSVIKTLTNAHTTGAGSTSSAAIPPASICLPIVRPPPQQKLLKNAMKQQQTGADHKVSGACFRQIERYLSDWNGCSKVFFYYSDLFIFQSTLFPFFSELAGCLI
jgi:hypothetical protein